MAPNAPRNLFDTARRSRFQTLFVCLIVLCLLNPLVEKTTTGRVLLYALLCINLLAAILAVSEHRTAVYIAGFLLFSAFLAWTISTFRRENYMTGLMSQSIADGLMFAAFVFTSALILKDVLKAGPVTSDKIFAAICVYLLMGIAWGLMYILLFLNNKAAFAFETMPVQEEQLDDTTFLFSHFCYYSFVTMTTLGYGDIVPTSAFTRTFSWIQAVLGQLYIAVLIARLVGLHTQNALPDDTDESSSTQ